MSCDNTALTSAQVSLHNNAKDCWVIINAKAYDVTNFLDDHPGGDEVLLGAAGKDASEEFEDAGHGSAARLMLDEFYVGEAKADSLTTQKKIAREPHVSRNKLWDSMINLRQLLLPLAILGFAVGIHFYR